MDYQSYLAMCDSSLQKIRTSENKRQVLDHKLQKMYQEKSEREKSIIKTLQSQQKQFMEENRRRAERNESILRNLERIDYQASVLAQKTDRLRAMKKQYERYLLSLWCTRRQAVYLPVNHKKPLPSQVAPRYEEFPFNQSFNYEPSIISVADGAYKSSYPSVAPSTVRHPTTHSSLNNQSYFRPEPFKHEANSIKSSNYQTTGVNESHFSYPFTPLHMRSNDSASLAAASSSMLPQYQQTVGKISQYSFESAINNDDTYLPPTTTINSIYNRQQQAHYLSPQLGFPSVDVKSVKTFSHSIHNQPLENPNYIDGESDSKMSETLYNAAAFIQPAPKTAPAIRPYLPKPSTLMLSKENPLKNISSENVSNVIHMSDGDEETESDAEKCDVIMKKKNIRRADPPSGKHYSTTTTNEITSKSIKQLDTPNYSISDNTQLKITDTNIKGPQVYVDTSSAIVEPEIREARSMNSALNENMHQVWEKVIEADPLTDTQHVSNFIIPKIVVETQIDFSEVKTTSPASPCQIIAENECRNSNRISPDEVLSDELEKLSVDNEMLSHESQPAMIESNNLPLGEESGSSIYHYEKQPSSDEQQNQKPQSKVEQELSHVDEIKITSAPTIRMDKNDNEATQIMTYESEIKTNNSLAKGDIAEEDNEAINNINTTKEASTSAALSDKINEIYRKIERIEGEYYDEKGKIIENYEHRLSSSPMNNDGARNEFQSIMESTRNVDDDIEKSQEFQVTNLSSAELCLQNDENPIYETHEMESKNDQSEFVADTNWNESVSQENIEPNYNYQNPSENEQLYQQSYNDIKIHPSENFAQPQNNNDVGSQQYFDNQYAGGDQQQQVYDSSQYEYVTNQHESEPLAEQNYQAYENSDQQQTEYIYTSPDNTQQNYEQQQGANNYNLYNPQLDFNYQQNNYVADENPSNYTNDSNVYHDNDQTQQHETVPTSQQMYDDQNNQTQQAQYENNEGTAANYAYQTNEMIHQDQSNELNYGNAEQQESFNETSGENSSTQYQKSEYETDAEKYESNDAYETHQANEMVLENVNYETSQFPQENSENVEHTTSGSDRDLERDEGDTTTSPLVDNDNISIESEGKIDANRGDIAEISVVHSSKRDDVKLVKQLLDSESDDNTIRSNLLKTAIKEETEESDFDFSAS